MVLRMQSTPGLLNAHIQAEIIKPIKKFIHKVGWRRLLFVIPIGIWLALVAYDPFRHNWYYVTASIGLTSIIFLYNFPFFTRFVHTRPMYFRDLEDANEPNETKKYMYQISFMHVMNFVLTIFLCIFFDYIIYTLQEKDHSWLEALSFIGGLIKILGTVQENFGKFLLYVLNFAKNKHVKDREQKRRESVMLDDESTDTPPRTPELIYKNTKTLPQAHAQDVLFHMDPEKHPTVV